MIDQAILFALMSLCFAGLNEIMFKRYNSRQRSRGMLICGIGVVWTIALWIDMTSHAETFRFDETVLIYGTLAGLSVAIANILLLLSLKHLEVSLGSTIYRLNTIAVVLLSVLFLGETLSVLKIAGIFLGVLAVVLLFKYHQTGNLTSNLKTGLAIVVSASLLRALYGVISKAGLIQGADANAMILESALFWIISGLAYACLVERRFRISRDELLYASVCGVLVYGIVRSLISALERGEATVVVPIANMSFLASLLIALALKMEFLNWRKAVAILLATGAIALLSQA